MTLAVIFETSIVVERLCQEWGKRNECVLVGRRIVILNTFKPLAVSALIEGMRRSTSPQCPLSANPANRATQAGLREQPVRRSGQRLAGR